MSTSRSLESFSRQEPVPNGAGQPSALKQPVNQMLLFARLRWMLLGNAWRQLTGHSLVRPATILLSSCFVVAFVFLVSYAGFRFVLEVIQVPRAGQLIEMLVGLLFFSLGALLIFSGGLILHGSLFNTAETAFLLSKPVSADQVFAYKFQGAIAFSSWAFLLLGGPILIAYAIVAECAWYFYLLLPVFFLGFVLLPGSVGAIACLLLVNYVPQRRKTVLVLLIVLLVVVTVWWSYSVIQENRRIARSTEPFTEAANQFLNRLSFARSLWLPSAWVARGLMACARGDLSNTGYYLSLIWSNGLMLYLVAAWCAGRLYRRGYNRLATGGDLRRKHGGAWMDRLLSGLLFAVHPGTRLLILKDFRTFRRDPQQYGQVLVFTGLLVLYFTNIRRLFLTDMGWPNQNGISFLNLCAIAMLLSAYTGRFIYPLLSLEGRKFWILGLLPLERDRLLWGKFVFSLTGGLLLSGSLVVLSDIMLEMPIDLVLLHFVTIAVLAAGLSGLAVGIGALMPNFRESDPSKIAVGFGGTVNLILGLAFLLVVVAVMAGPWHAWRSFYPPGLQETPLGMLLTVGLGVFVGLIAGAVAVLLPLRAGIEALRRMEF
jgi:ABC-2 type transport system permease protein